MSSGTSVFEAPQRPPDVDFTSMPNYPPAHVRIWYACSDGPGLLDVSAVSPSGPDGGRNYWVQAQCLSIVSNAGLQPALEASGIKILDERGGPGHPRRIRVTTPTIFDFCAGGTAYLAATTPPDQEPFGLEPYIPPPGEGPSLPVRPVMEALRRRRMLFVVHALTDPISGIITYGDYSNHDMFGHSAWLGTTPKARNKLVAYSDQLCADAKAAGNFDDGTEAMGAFDGDLDQMINNIALSGAIETGVFSAGPLEAIVGPDVWQETPAYIGSLPVIQQLIDRQFSAHLM